MSPLFDTEYRVTEYQWFILDRLSLNFTKMKFFKKLVEEMI